MDNGEHPQLTADNLDRRRPLAARGRTTPRRARRRRPGPCGSATSTRSASPTVSSCSESPARWPCERIRSSYGGLLTRRAPRHRGRRAHHRSRGAHHAPPSTNRCSCVAAPATPSPSPLPAAPRARPLHVDPPACPALAEPSSVWTPRNAQRALHVRPLRHRHVEPLRARRRALSVAETPARSYNPLFIYGPAGLGKTHLLHAIGNYVRDVSKLRRVRYVSTETFMNEFVEAIRNEHHARVPTPQPRGRRAPHRRHPVPRAQPAAPGGVLPHVQHAPRGRQPDRPLVGPAAQGRSRRLEDRLRPASSGASSPTSSRPSSRPASRSCG